MNAPNRDGRTVISRKPGQSITILDAASGRRTVVTHRAPAGALEVTFEAGTVVVRSELLDGEAKAGLES